MPCLHRWHSRSCCPAFVTNGTEGFITLSFTGLAPATKYLGTVIHGGYPGLWSTTVPIDTP